MAVVDPDQILTRQQLNDQLAGLFHAGGWSYHRLAEAANLSTATVHHIVDGTTGVPQSGTLVAFVEACGQKPEPWMRARSRVLQSEMARRKSRSPSASAKPIIRDFFIVGCEIGRAHV